EKRFTEYKLVEHPSSPEKMIKKWKPKKSKRSLGDTSRNMKLDQWF
ncbi:unnamed protein product, partial [marine sediment metagenome]